MRINTGIKSFVISVWELPSKIFRPITSALNAIFGNKNTCQGRPNDFEADWNNRWEIRHPKARVLTPEEYDIEIQNVNDLVARIKGSQTLKETTIPPRPSSPPTVLEFMKDMFGR
ncbi:MAG: hypothetical protein KR126chlam3_01262 [Chlamydiae bacterium]|nr:hypothetical protein [Chlamydiota bacterium]